MYGIAAALTAGAMVWVDRPDAGDATVPPAPARTRSLPGDAVAQPPGGPPRSTINAAEDVLDLKRLGRRGFAPQGGDLFGAPARAAPPAPIPEAPLKPAEPSAPPLPFTFVGKWMENGETVVFLAGNGRSYMARVGAKLGGAYAVEAVDDAHLVLTYLPLGKRQTLSLRATPRANGGSAIETAHAGEPSGGSAEQEDN